MVSGLNGKNGTTEAQPVVFKEGKNSKGKPTMQAWVGEQWIAPEELRAGVKNGKYQVTLTKELAKDTLFQRVYGEFFEKNAHKLESVILGKGLENGRMPRKRTKRTVERSEKLVASARDGEVEYHAEVEGKDRPKKYENLTGKRYKPYTARNGAMPDSEAPSLTSNAGDTLEGNVMLMVAKLTVGWDLTPEEQKIWDTRIGEIELKKKHGESLDTEEISIWKAHLKVMVKKLTAGSDLTPEEQKIWDTKIGEIELKKKHEEPLDKEETAIWEAHLKVITKPIDMEQDEINSFCEVSLSEIIAGAKELREAKGIGLDPHLEELRKAAGQLTNMRDNRKGESTSFDAIDKHMNASQALEHIRTAAGKLQGNSNLKNVNFSKEEFLQLVGISALLSNVRQSMIDSKSVPKGGLVLAGKSQAAELTSNVVVR